MNLSESSGRSDGAVITADGLGGIHVAWAESSSDSPEAPLDTIFYRHYQNGIWEPSNDILVWLQPGEISPTELQVDPYGDLILVAVTGRGLLINRAPADEAASARAWSSTVLEPGQRVLSAALEISTDGVYHLAYTTIDRGLVYRKSTDGGRTWNKEMVILSAMEVAGAFAHVSMAFDQRGNGYATWTVQRADTNWAAAGVWLAQTHDMGETWLRAEEFVSEPGYGQSTAFVTRAGEAIITWVGDLNVGGRYERRSRDQGATWSEVRIIAGPESIRGYAGPIQLLEDAKSTLHAIYPGFGAGKDQIWYAKWIGDRWMEPISISPDTNRSERPRAALLGGHLIAAVWYEYATTDVWSALTTTGAREVFVTPQGKPSTASLSPTKQAASTYEPTQTATPAVLEPSTSSAPPEPGPTTGLVIMISVLPAALLVLVVAVLKARR